MQPTFIAPASALVLLLGACTAAQPSALVRRARPRTQAPSDDWEISASLGTALVPSYLGADSYQTFAFPDFSAKKGDFFASLFQGTGYDAIRSDRWRSGPIVRYQFGRDETGDNPLRITGRVDDDLRGLGDVDDTIELGGFLEYRARSVSGRLEVRQGLGGHEGLIGEVKVSLQRPITVLGKSLFYSVGPEFRFGDGTYSSSYFDVNAAQAAASGLEPYDADGMMLSAGFNASLVIPMTDAISIITFTGYSRLFGDVADSSLVTSRGSDEQFTGGLMLSYRF